MTGRALVTGATGFIGAHLARRLVADGWRVSVLVRDGRRLPADLAAACSLVPASADAGTLAAAVRADAPDACFHLAGHVIGPHRPADVDLLLESNVALGTRLADALAALPDVAFVNTGTVWQHHDGRPYGPASLYAATKQAFADVLQYYAECTPLRAVTVELPQVYGPGDRRGRLLHQLVEAHRTGTSVALSPGHQLLAFTHVSDVVEALVQALQQASPDAPVLTLDVQTVTLREFVDVVGDVLGAPVPVSWGALEYRSREMFRSWDQGRALPGWRPAIGLREGLLKVLGEERTDTVGRARD